jgi:hypothetical protein
MRGGILCTDAVNEAYTWAFRPGLISALARDGVESGVSWWAVLDDQERPVGAVAARDWDDLPARTLRPEFTLAPIDAYYGWRRGTAHA